MFKAHIEIKLDRPSKTVKTPRESMGTESEYFSTVFIQLRSRLYLLGICNGCHEPKFVYSDLDLSLLTRKGYIISYKLMG